MIDSAHILPLEPTLPPWNETLSPAQAPYVPATAHDGTPNTDPTPPILPVPVDSLVDLNAPLDAAAYATVDRGLAYRDLVNAAAVAKVAITANEVWGFKPPYLGMAGPANDQLSNLGLDWQLQYVQRNSTPSEALDIDAQLARRDGLIFNALAHLAEDTFAWYTNPLPPSLSDEDDASDLWALAQGAPSGRLPNNNDRVSTELFSSADRVLAWRDNVVASYAVELKQRLKAYYNFATRIAISDGTSIGWYTLESEDDVYRTFSTYPAVAGQRRLVYNRQQSEFYFNGSGSSNFSGPVSSVLMFPSATINANVSLNSIYLQARNSGALSASNQSNTVVFRTSRLYDYAQDLELVQSNYLLLPAPGELVTLCVPAPISSGYHRIGVCFATTRTLLVAAAENTDGIVIDDTTDVAVVPGQSLHYSFAVPAGRLSVQANVLSQSGPYSCSFQFNGQTVFYGAVNAGVDAESSTPPSQITSPGGICTIAFTLNSGAVQLHSLQLTVEGTGPVLSAIKLEVVARDDSVTLIGELRVSTIPDALECVIFDSLFNTLQYGARFRITHLSDEGCGLKLYQLDARRVSSTQLDPGIDGHKADLLRRAADSLKASYAVLAPQFESAVVSGAFGSTEYAAWVALTGQRTILDSAFPLAGPGDTGYPALVPRGLVLSSTGVIQTLGALAAQPRLQPLQPWMLAFGVRVASQAFVPPRPSVYAGTGSLPSASLQAIPLCQCGNNEDPYITRIEGRVLFGDGGEYAGYTAMSIPNCGAGGGYGVYTLRVTVTIIHIDQLFKLPDTTSVDEPQASDYPWLPPDVLALLMALGAFGATSKTSTKLVSVLATYLVTDLATSIQTTEAITYAVAPLGTTLILPEYIPADGTVAELQSVTDLQAVITP